ncbi:hypothetical protein ElyMa_001900800 [Elysia marginata]|uniref:Uncharacterized protein n=1 Tax=Elysia marginata TaxID=1093978 RepID=A0AAV4ETF3_9GAST|nr:hypothetical protein ElyMa_001900800 [Elysia marginata]
MVDNTRTPAGHTPDNARRCSGHNEQRPVAVDLCPTRSIPAGHRRTRTNDLTVDAKDQFLIPNCPTYHFGLLAFLENCLPFHRGGVFFYCSTDWKLVVPDLDLPNGIFLSRDLKKYSPFFIFLAKRIMLETLY